jgi:(p)ppGpp synthase/HD superfamily hydrolase
MSDLQQAWLAAWSFAARAHNAQRFPGTDLPYLVHVGAVAMEILVAHQQRPFARPILAVQCALLHDTIEDTSTTEEEIASRFGADVAAGVRALTKDKKLVDAMGDSLARIKQQPVEIWAVKLADRITNLGPPPGHWTEEKIKSYAVEAKTILDALGDAHGPLAWRFGERLAAYPPQIKT